MDEPMTYDEALIQLQGLKELVAIQHLMAPTSKGAEIMDALQLGMDAIKIDQGTPPR